MSDKKWTNEIIFKLSPDGISGNMLNNLRDLNNK